MSFFRVVIAAAAVTSLSACASAYYGTLENFGIEKRDVLVDRVDDGRKSQVKAQKEFKDGLERFRAVVSVDGGDLEKKYDRLSKSYENMQDEADDVRDRIDSIEDVGNALFKEWKRELDQYADASLRARSEEQYRVTQTRYQEVLRAMNNAAERMDPVLQIYGDQVLFLKHNLNARAISSLDTERLEIEARVGVLIREMDRAIAEANAFIETMGRS